MMRFEDVKAGALVQGMKPGVVIDFLEPYAHTERASQCEYEELEGKYESIR